MIVIWVCVEILPSVRNFGFLKKRNSKLDNFEVKTRVDV